MDAFTILLVALALAMDALAVSIACGITLERVRIRNAFQIAAFFGSFQAGMPVIGWTRGSVISYMISGIDHWMAFGILAFIGSKMIYECRKSEPRCVNALGNRALLLLSVATSIDALGAGASFAFAKTPILAPAAVIGVITFAISYAGVYLGDRIGHTLERLAGMLGGVVLIGIGARILVGHLF